MTKSCVDGSSPTGNRAIWSRLTLELRGEILSGRFAEHEQLPGENDLAELFSVHRHTVRKAIRALEGEGLLRVRHGSGTYINREVIDYHIGVRTRFTENLMRHGLSSRGDLLACTTVAVPEDVANALALDAGAGAEVIRLDLLRYAANQPMSFATHYLQAGRFDGIDLRFAELRSLTSALKTFGIEDYIRIETLVSGRLPTELERANLKIASTSPIFEIRGRNATRDGKVFLYTVARMPCLRVQLSFGGDGEGYKGQE
ncbi:phosphonate metabolism transcriptional regulator PhnF [Hyphomicrobium sp. CS1BSMeth3]|uniref:phosphonate metabolism transcriptional regulator PhnF n=1 Tax=Hyphomicrobium sp. CS1BSMeth3 TaxID=1892844 RepID=UPI0009FB69A8|nr:phosphonate metabolism transcriptional regulator PhnF [Hyphomicrobium sp. CS1BSMeth3]